MKDFIKHDISKSMQKYSSRLDVLKGKTILITGGTGFVGSWVARTLAWLNDEHSFECNLILLSRDPKRLEKMDAELYNRADITFIRSDIRSLHSLPKSVSYIIHAAASPDNRVHMSDPVNTMDVIAMGTKVVLEEVSRLTDIEGIIYISSGQVYGSNSVNGSVLSENMLGGNITSIYPEAKRYAEKICLAYRSQYKLPISIVRPFSFIGPFQSLSKPWAINTFLQEALNIQPMRIVGNGKPQRSYMYASDMAAWLLITLVNCEKPDVYNLGSSEGVSLLALANKINMMVSNPVDVMIQNFNEDDSSFLPNTEYIINKLDVQEAFSFEESLEHTIKWNMNYLKKGQ